MRKMQQRLYPWAIRQLFPQYKYIKFEIGYINLGLSISWIVDPDDGVYVINELSEMWDNICTKYKGAHPTDLGNYPEKYGEHCRWCGFKSNCNTFANATQEFVKSIQVLFHNSPEEEQPDDKPLAIAWERYAQLTAIKKNVDSELGELKQVIMDILAISKDGKRTVLGYDLRRYKKTSNKIYLDQMWPYLIELLNEHPELLKDMLDPAVITTKITGINKLAKKYPELKQFFKDFTTKVEAKDFTLEDIYTF